MKNILAENLLRFGAKNLDNQSINKINILIEQAQQAGIDINTIKASDPAEVKVGVYNDVMNWWSSHMKLSSTRRSLELWSGSTQNVTPGSGGSKSQDLVTANLKKALNAPEIKGKTFAGTLNTIITDLEKNSSNNLYLKVGAFQQDPFLNMFIREYPANQIVKLNDVNSQPYKYLSNLQKNLNTIWPKINNKNNVDVITAITAEDKIALMASIQQRTEQRVQALTNQGKQTNTAAEIKKAKQIVISADKGELTIVQGETPTEIRTWQRSYPDITKPDSTEMQNFYLQDNTVEIKPEAQAAFQEIINNTLAEVKSAGGKVIEINYWSGAKTSKVPTMYDSANTGYKPGGDIPTGQKGNVKLANDRAAAINEFLSKTLTTAFPGVKITHTKDQIEPNVGPEYTQKERMEYSKRSQDPDKQAKYDTTYGPYKGSYGAFNLIVEFSVEKSTTEERILTAGKWFAKIEWPVRVVSDGKKPNIGGNAGGGRSFVGMVAPTDCPWDK